MSRGRRAALLAALFLTAAVVLGAALAQRGMMGAGPDGYAANGYGRGGGMMGGNGYGMGGYGMGGSAYQGQAMTWNAAQQAIQDSAPGATVNAADNSLTFTGTHIHMNVIAVQPGKPDTTFEVGGLVDPTLHIPRGATVTMTLVNMDYGQDMPHGLVLTRRAPPYPYMGTGMMVGGSGIPPLAARTSDNLQNATYASGTLQFSATVPGTYYYVCQVPGHAQEGMYGKIIID